MKVNLGHWTRKRNVMAREETLISCPVIPGLISSPITPFLWCQEHKGKVQQEAKVRQRAPWTGWTGHSPCCRAALWAVISTSTFFSYHHPRAQLAGTGSMPEDRLFSPWGQHKTLPQHKQGQVQPPEWVVLPAAGTAGRSLQSWSCCKPCKGSAATHISLPPLLFCFEKWQWIHTKPQLQKIMGFSLVCAVKLY